MDRSAVLREVRSMRFEEIHGRFRVGRSSCETVAVRSSSGCSGPCRSGLEVPPKSVKLTCYRQTQSLASRSEIALVTRCVHPVYRRKAEFRLYNPAMRNLDDVITFAKIVEMRSHWRSSCPWASKIKCQPSAGPPRGTTWRPLAATQYTADGADRRRRAVLSVLRTDCRRIGCGRCGHTKPARGPPGLLRLTMPVAFGQHFMAPIFVDFLNLYPDVRVKLVLRIGSSM